MDIHMKKMQKFITQRQEGQTIYHTSVVEKLIRENETGTVIYDAAFISYPKAYVKPTSAVFKSRTFNVNVINGAGMADTQYVSPGTAFPQAPTTLRYGNQGGGIELGWGERFAETAIILSGGEVFEKASGLIPKPEGLSDQSIIQIGENAEKMKFSREYMISPTGCFNLVSNPFDDNNLPPYVDLIFEKLFPELNKDDNVLIFIGTKSTLVSMGKYFLLGDEHVNKYNNKTLRGDFSINLADHRLFLAKQSIQVPFNNQHLNSDSEDLMATIYPVFHGSNQICLSEDGNPPFNETHEQFHAKTIKTHIQLYDYLIDRREKMQVYNSCKFMGCAAINILMNDPIMTNVDVFDDRENPIMLLNAKLDVIYSAVITQKKVNANVIVKPSNLFQTGYAATIEKLSFSPCKFLSYRKNYTNISKPILEEELTVKDAKGIKLKKYYPHTTERAALYTSYINSVNKNIHNTSDEMRQLLASMSLVTNSMIQLFDIKSLFNAETLESRAELIETTGATIDGEKYKDIGFMTAVRGGRDMVARNIPSPDIRILAKLGGSIFALKNIFESCMMIIESKMPYKSKTLHPAMIAIDSENPSYCCWHARNFIDEAGFCPCALLAHTSNILTGGGDSETKMNEIYAICFPLSQFLKDEDDKKVVDVQMEPFGMHFSLRTDDSSSKFSCFGDVTLRNNNGEDEHGLMSKNAFERKKSKKEAEKFGVDGVTTSEGINAEKDEEEKEVDYSKDKKMELILRSVLQHNPTILNSSQSRDFSTMGLEDVKGLTPEMKQSFEKFKKICETLNETEKNVYDGRKLISGLGCFAFDPQISLLNVVLEDDSKVTDYTIPPLQKGLPNIIVKGVKQEKNQNNQSDKIEMDEEDDGDYEEVYLSLRKKRKMNIESAAEIKRIKLDSVDQETCNLARALYVYASESLENNTEPFIRDKLPDEYKKIVNDPAKFKKLVLFLGYMVGMNTTHRQLSEDERSTSSILMKSMADYVRAIAHYMTNVANTIKDDCGFETPEIMHDRFTGHTSQTNKLMSRQITAVIDPASVGDVIQKINERKFYNTLGKQYKDVEDQLHHQACDLDPANIATAIRQSDIPHVNETLLPIPYNLQKIVFDTQSGKAMIDYSVDLSNYSTESNHGRKQNGLTPVNLITYTIMQIKMKSGMLSDDRKEIKNEFWSKSYKPNTEKLTAELEKLYTHQQKSKVYVAHPLTCNDYNTITNGHTGAGSTGPLSTPILSALFMKNNVRFDKISHPDFTTVEESKKSAKFIMSFIREMSSNTSNHENCNVSCFSKGVIRELYKIVVQHSLVVNKIIEFITAIRTQNASAESCLRTLKNMFTFKKSPSINLDMGAASLKRMLDEKEETGPVLHLILTLAQIYGSRGSTENRLFSEDLERDQEAAKIITAGIINLTTSKKDNSQTISKFKGKNQGLGTTITCHANFSMTAMKPVMMCTSGDFLNNGEPRLIFKGRVGSYQGISKSVILRSLCFDKHFFNKSLPGEVVKQNGSMFKTGSSVIIKTAAVHFNKTEKVMKEINPVEVMKSEDLEILRNAITNTSDARKLYDYICALLYPDGIIPILDIFNNDIINRFLPDMNTPIRRVQVMEEFTKLIANNLENFISSTEESDEDYDMFGDDSPFFPLEKI